MATHFFVSVVCESDEVSPNWDALHRAIADVIESHGAKVHGVKAEPFPTPCGRIIEHPIVMRRDQFLTVECDLFGRFQKCREDMPPMVNHKRLQMPTRYDEKMMREREWSEAQSEMYKP